VSVFAGHTVGFQPEYSKLMAHERKFMKIIIVPCRIRYECSSMEKIGEVFLFSL